MFFTIEPMVNAGRPEVKVLDDGWTAVTRDRSLSAQFEHMVGVTETGVEIFTSRPPSWTSHRTTPDSARRAGNARRRSKEEPRDGHRANGSGGRHQGKAEYVAGRRAFFKYRDLGVTAATHRRMRAQVTSAEQGMSKETGWHVHKCEAQFVYMLSGWVDLEFADRKVRLSAGDSMLIPGDTPHNETGTSDTFETAGDFGARRHGHRALRRAAITHLPPAPVDRGNAT